MSSNALNGFLGPGVVAHLDDLCHDEPTNNTTVKIVTIANTTASDDSPANPTTAPTEPPSPTDDGNTSHSNAPVRFYSDQSQSSTPFTGSDKHEPSVAVPVLTPALSVTSPASLGKFENVSQVLSEGPAEKPEPSTLVQPQLTNVAETTVSRQSSAIESTSRTSLNATGAVNPTNLNTNTTANSSVASRVSASSHSGAGALPRLTPLNTSFTTAMSVGSEPSLTLVSKMPASQQPLVVPPAEPLPPPLATEIAVSPLPSPPLPIDIDIVNRLKNPAPPPFPFHRAAFPIYSGPLDGVQVTGKYSHRYASGWYYVGDFVDSLRRGHGELYYSNGGDDYIVQPPSDYNENAHIYNRFITEGNAEMKAQDLQKNYAEAYEPQGPRPAFKKTGKCEYNGCSALLLARPRHHCRQCGNNFCAQHGQFHITLPRLYYPLDLPQKVCKSCYDSDRLISRTVTGDIYVGEFQYNYCWGEGTYYIQTKRERYEGQFYEGRMSGAGRYLFSNGDVFVGNYALDKRSGFGTVQYHLNGVEQIQQDREELLSMERKGQQDLIDRDDATEEAAKDMVASITRPEEFPNQKGECLFQGDWSNDLPHGKGIFVTSALLYSGDFVAGERSGSATIIIKATGERYDGSVVRGVRDGYGVMISPYGGLRPNRYEGDWKDNRRHGHGKWEYHRQRVPSWFGVQSVNSTKYLNTYTGAWYNDSATGVGKHCYWDGSHYEGQHLNLLPSGQGVMTYCNSDQYVGAFLKGKRHGQGKIVYSTQPFQLVTKPDSDGCAVEPTQAELAEMSLMAALPRPIYIEYNGQWVDDQPHGQGSCIYPDGAIYTGSMASGQITGQGRTVYRNGDVYVGEHRSGIRDGDGTYTWALTGNSYSGQWREGRRYVPPIDTSAALDDTKLWNSLKSHSYRHIETGEVYEGESLYVGSGDWAMSKNQRSLSSSLTFTVPHPQSLHPSNPDDPAYVRHGHGILRANIENRVYSHWMGQWRNDLRHGNGRLHLLSSLSVKGATTEYSGHVIEGEWNNDQPPHSGLVRAVSHDPKHAYSFYGLLSASIRPFKPMASVSDGEVISPLSPSSVNDSVDLFTWSQLSMARLVSPINTPVSALSSAPSASLVNVNVPLSSSFVLSPTGIGRYHFPNGDVYHGQFYLGLAQGKGQCRYVYDTVDADTNNSPVLNNFQTYTGQWNAGRHEGLGRMVFADGSEYKGYWKHGDREGLGEFTAILLTNTENDSEGRSLTFHYKGEWQNDLPCGCGTLSCRSYVYEGEFQAGEFHGHGRIRWADGSTHNGTWRNGRREGHGISKSAEENFYIGSMWYGRYHGYGAVHYTLTLPLETPALSNTTIVQLDPLTPSLSLTLNYTGDFWYGFKTGTGRLMLRLLDKLHQSLIAEVEYCGEFQGDQFHGRGVLSIYKLSTTTLAVAGASSAMKVLASRYDGEWYEGQRHGAGVQHFEDGRIYDGEWDSNSPNGQGRMLYPFTSTITDGDNDSDDSTRDSLPVLSIVDYNGSWLHGVRHGSGTLLYNNGDEYNGEIADNHRHGSGSLTLANGDVVKGIWKDDKKDGRCIYTFYRPVIKGSKFNLPANQFPPTSSSPLHYLATVESEWKEDLLHGTVLFRFLPSTTAFLTAIHTAWVDGLLDHSHPIQVVYAETGHQSQVYQGQVVAATTEAHHFDLHQLAGMAASKSNPSVLSASSTQIPSFEDYVSRLPILASLSPVFPAVGPFFPFHVFAVVFCHTRVSRQGVGLLRTAAGEEYLGQWRNDLRHGRGQQVFVAGTGTTTQNSVFVGAWSNDQMHGRGSLYIESKELKLTTMFARGKANTEIKGKGKLEDYASQSVYQGDLTNMIIMNGIGQLVYADGSSYMGSFLNGEPEGLGRRIESDGSVHIGYWIKGRKYGKGMSVSAEGMVERGSWKLDRKDGMFQRERHGQLARVKYVDGAEKWVGK